jgi:ATP synthase protein I
MGLAYTARRFNSISFCEARLAVAKRAGMRKEDQSKKARPLLIGVGSMLTSMIVAGFILGYAVDWWLGTLPWFLLGFGVLGFIGGILKVHKLLTHPGMF